jgi:predicted metal-binding protein
MRQFSLRRQKQETKLIAVVAKIRKERGGKCEDCDSAGITDPSHNYSRKDFASLIADPENITLLCRRHHQAFENNMLWEFKTDFVLRKMKSQFENEPDIFRKDRMRSHLVGKLFNAKDNALEWEQKLPAWVDVLLDEL